MLLLALAAGCVVYVLAVYPLLLALLVRLKPKPVDKRLDYYRTVSILLPVRNGAPWILRKLESIRKLNYPREALEVIVVSDGSEDATEEIVRAFGHGVRLLSIPASGKAAALNCAMAHARGEILFFTDVRQELDPDSLRNLVACFTDERVGAVSGELIIRDGDSRAEANVGLYWKYEKWIRKHLSRLDSVPGMTGCVYAMRADLAAPLAPGAILDDMDLPLGAFFRGYRLVFDDAARAYDEPATLGIEFRRKVRTQAGVLQTITRFPRLLGPSNRMWFHFVSHKCGRLLLPYALLALFVAGFRLPWPAAPWVVAPQLAFYSLAAADPAIPETWRLKRVTSPVRTFVVLMAAALCAVVILFRPQTALWTQTRAGAVRETKKARAA